jgi:hypothetical protein
MAVHTRRMISVVLTTGSGKTYTLDTYPGDVKITGLQEAARETSIILDRGIQVERVYGDDVEQTLTIDVYHDGALSATGSSALGDFLVKKAGSYVASDTTTDPGGQVWCVKVVVTSTHPGGVTQTFTAGNARPVGDYSAAKEGNTLSLTFSCTRPTGGADPIVIA